MNSLSIVIIALDNEAETKACEAAARAAAPEAEIYVTMPAKDGLIRAKNEGIKNTSRSRILFLTPNMRITPDTAALLDIEADIIGSGAGVCNTRAEGRDIQKYSGGTLEFTGCLMVRRAVFDEVGPFDENIGLAWCEDPDMCWRASDVGLRIVQAESTGIEIVGPAPLDSTRLFNPQAAHGPAHEYMRKKWADRLSGKPQAKRTEKKKLEWLDANKKKILMVCPSFDCAGVSYVLSEAINQHSKEYTSRQIVSRTLDSFRFKYDMHVADYAPGDILRFIGEADIIHVNFGMPDEFLNGAVPWRRLARTKTIIYHSHSGWENGKDQEAIFKSGDMHRRIDFVDAVLGCSPVDAAQFDGGKWLPNVMREHPALKPLPNKAGRICISHSPSAKVNKSTAEFNLAVLHLRSRDFDFDDDVIFGETYDECLRRKQKSHIHFDNVWQGYHGMSSFEAMAQGIPALAHVDESVVAAHEELFGSCPIINVKTQAQIEATIADFLAKPETISKAGEASRKWMSEKYTTQAIVKMYENFYGGIKKKTTSQKHGPRRILVINHRHGDLSWTRGRWIESAIKSAGHDSLVFKNTWKQFTLSEILDKTGHDFDFILQLGEYSCPRDIADGERTDNTIPYVLWTDDSVVWDTFNQKDHKPHFQGLYYTKYLPLYDMIFELFPQSLPMVREFARCPVHLLMHAWEPTAWAGTRFNERNDVIFCGRYEGAESDFTGEGWYLRRGRVIDEIRNNGVKVKVYFSHDVKAWTGEIQASKIVLNKSLNFNINMRIFETLGAGKFLLTDRAHGLDSIFEDEKHLVYYDSPEHAAELAKYYLEHDSERNAIAEAWRKRASDGKHTYVDRVNELVSKVEAIL